MHRSTRRVIPAYVLAALAAVFGPACSDSDTDPTQDTSGADRTDAGEDGPSPGGDGEPGPTGGEGSPSGPDDGSPGGPRDPEPGSDAGAMVDPDGGVTEPSEPCDPNADGKVSAPGRYEGYSEVLYPDHERSSFYVEVRDGTRLAMDLFRPVDDSGALVETPLPVLWMHTPYNRRTFMGGGTAETYPGFALRLVEYGYIVAVVDFRGLYASFGTNSAYNRGEWVDAARMDAYDITEWLAEQPWSSGKIGMWGCSATGGSQMQAATTAPPHLKAIFPMSCEFDAYPFGVPGGMAPAEGDTRTAPGGGAGGMLRDQTGAAVDGADGQRLFREAIAEHAGNVENAGYVPYRDSVSANLDETWWLKSSPHTYLDAINGSGIGIYLAVNWDEGATKQGAFFTFNNVTVKAKIVAGPAGHCEWSNVKDQTGFDLVIEELRFFDYWLKDVQNCVMDEDPVHYYTYNATGDGWRSAPSWPLPGETRVPYYFADGGLSTEMPTAAEASDAVTGNASAEIVYTSEPLDAPVQVTGHPAADLWVSSTATDGDFIVTLEDVAPDGEAQSYFMNGRLRASHRALEDPPYDNLGLPYHPFTEAESEPLVPGEPTRLQFEMLPISIVFPEGHRIRVRVTFADTPTPVQTPAPTVTIYRDAEHPSAVVLPVVE